jgi:hypothetical protein
MALRIIAAWIQNATENAYFSFKLYSGFAAACRQKFLWEHAITFAMVVIRPMALGFRLKD